MLTHVIWEKCSPSLDICEGNLRVAGGSKQAATSEESAGMSFAATTVEEILIDSEN